MNEDYSLGQLDAAGADAVRRFEEERAASKRYPSLQQLIEQWAYFVEEVEGGYSDVIDEYTNDVSTRTVLEEFIQRAPTGLADRMRQLLEPIDARFRAATRSDDEGSVLRFYRGDSGWWWRRVPMEGELADYLAEVE